jgi:hypothetical protein
MSMPREHGRESQRGGQRDPARKPSTERGDLEGQSVDDLRRLAADLNIEDGYRMDRDELILAIQREREVREE